MNTIFKKWVFITLSILLGLAGCSGNGNDTPNLGTTGLDLSFPSKRLEMGVVNALYLDDLNTVTGGTTPYSWDIQISNLPPGMEVQGYETGIGLNGTPALAGEYNFDITVTDDVGDSITSSFFMTVVNTLDITGVWSYTMEVYQVTNDVGNVCSVGEIHTHTIFVTHDGSEYTFSNFFANPSSQLTGAYDEDDTTIRVTGSYPEDPGTTTGTHDLTIYTNDYMEGIESWEWTDGTNICDFGRATITAIRL